jgi:hypothetical protein
MNLHQWILMLTRYELLLGVLFLEVELDAKLVVLLVYYMLLLMVNMLALWMITVMKEPTTVSMQKKLDEELKTCFFISLCNFSFTPKLCGCIFNLIFWFYYVI